VLYVAWKLFEHAECDQAPEPWAHVAIGLMLHSHPAASVNGDVYRCSIADNLYRDPELTKDGRGFSCAVITHRHPRGAAAG
jgi:hypothetical protein